jgi:hypothetical protein
MRTRFTFAFVVFAVVGLILAAQLGAFQAQGSRAIPLDTAYATFNQEGIKALDNVADTEGLWEIFAQVQGGPQRIVLCEGKDVAAAVKSAGMSFTMSEMSSSMQDQPVPAITVGPDDTVWLAAFLGSDGSLPPAYKVRAINVNDRTIRVSYERDESSGRSCDLRAYMVWAPVGRVEAGEYTLELFDVVAGDVTATRAWQVSMK